jgi:hypothetical protein
MGRKYIYNSSLQTRIVDLRILFKPCRRGRHYELFKWENSHEIGKFFGSFCRRRRGSGALNQWRLRCVCVYIYPCVCV